MKQVIFQASNTQRVTAESYTDGSWLLSKEWRKQSGDDWIQGKGIYFPVINGQPSVIKLGQILLKGAGEDGTSDPKEDTHKS